MNSSGLAPTLDYFLIFNPSISSPSEDEDERERAQLLFYSAKEQAVSRDTILRQLGIAKALSRFTTIFDSSAPCDSVHSLSRRMVLFSPEPDFWLQICFSIGQTPIKKSTRHTGKNHDKKQHTTLEPVESSLHDSALRMKLCSGYEAFKLRYGSFTSVMSLLGKEALELQLERFFTVWCWSWDLLKKECLDEYFGSPAYPQIKSLQSIFSRFDDTLPSGFTLVALTASHILAQRPLSSRPPTALLRRLMKIAGMNANGKGPVQLHGEIYQEQDTPPEANSETTLTKSEENNKGFLNAPLVSLGMDMGNWTWLKGPMFSRSTKSKPDDNKHEGSVKTVKDSGSVTTNPEDPVRHAATRQVGAEVDYTVTAVDNLALSDALVTDYSNSAQERTPEENDSPSAMPPVALDSVSAQQQPPIVVRGDTSEPQSSLLQLEGEEAPLDSTDQNDSDSRPAKNLDVTLKSTTYSEFVASFDTPSSPFHTCSTKLKYKMDDGILIAIIPPPDYSEDQFETFLAEIDGQIHDAMIYVRNTIDIRKVNSSTAISPSVQNLLQKSRHIIVTGDRLAHSSTSPPIANWHAFEGSRLFDMKLQEIYSRGQNPQDWQLAKRGISGASIDCGDVFMEIGRKEASLVDVDNELSALLRRYKDSSA